MWFQQEGATCHAARVTMDLLRGGFGEHFISRSIDALEDSIEAFIRVITAEILEKVCQNWTYQMDHSRRSSGQHLHEIIFKH